MKRERREVEREERSREGEEKKRGRREVEREKGSREGEEK